MQIRNVANGKCLTDPGRGAQLIVIDCVAGYNASQTWRILPHVEGWYSIHSMNMNFIDVNEDRIDNGSKIQSWERNLSNVQRYQIFPSGSNFIISKAYANKVFDVDPATMMVRVWDANSSDNQKFKFIARYDN